MSNGLLAVVPARGGSRGIPLKVLQPVNGVPLVLHTLALVKAANVAKRTVVSTEDSYIASVVEAHGHEVLKRPPELAADGTPLIDVANEVVERLHWKGTVAIFQPTCPLLSVTTIRRVVDQFRTTDYDWAITTHKSPHIYWQEGECCTPRVNRQELDEHLSVMHRETGAIQLMTPEFAHKQHGRVGTIEIDAAEALDIDTPEDLAIARMRLGRRSIAFRVLMSPRYGTGHFWRALALADALSHHDIYWEWEGEPEGWARQMVEQRGWHDVPAGFWPDLWVYDCLDATRREIANVHAQGAKVVAFEDENGGARHADLVVNELYDHGDLHGPRYAVFRPEFMGLTPLPIAEKGEKVLVTFGGSDPAGLNQHYAAHLRAYCRELRVAERGVSMAKQMRWADLVVTGQGRTVGEAAMCGVPVLSIAVNDRESHHARIPGVQYMGLHATLADHQVGQAVGRLLADRMLREEMVQRARACVDGRGLQRIVRRIEDLLEGLD